MRRLLRAIVLSIIAAAAPAFADPPEGELNASVGALASGMIGDANAEGVFEIVPAEHLIAVRHAGSGLVCEMDPGWANRLLIFPQMARGEDVACDTSDGRQTLTLYATRFSFETSVEEQLAGAVDAMRQRFPNARPYPPTGADAAGAQSAEFIVNRTDGAQMYTRVSVAMVRGWVIKLRYSALAPDDTALRQSQAATGARWRAVMEELSTSHS